MLAVGCVAIYGAYETYKSKDKNAKNAHFPLIIGTALIVFGYIIYSEHNTSHGEQISFSGRPEDIKPFPHLPVDDESYTIEYTATGYNAAGYSIGTVTVKSKGGQFYAFPPYASHPTDFWDAPYDAPHGCRYSCAWGGEYIYF